MTEDRVLCDAYFADCACFEAAGHKGAHLCKCGGSWEGSDGEPDGITAIHSFPDPYAEVGPVR